MSITFLRGTDWSKKFLKLLIPSTKTINIKRFKLYSYNHKKLYEQRRWIRLWFQSYHTHVIRQRLFRKRKFRSSNVCSRAVVENETHETYFLIYNFLPVWKYENIYRMLLNISLLSKKSTSIKIRHVCYFLIQHNLHRKLPTTIRSIIATFEFMILSTWACEFKL